MKQKWKSLSLGAQLTILILSISILSMTILALGLSFSTANYFRNEVRENLQSIAGRQLGELNLYLSERDGDITTISRNPLIAKLISENNSSKKMDSELYDFLNFYLTTYRYKNIYMLNRQGKILFSMLHPELIGTTVLQKPIFQTELAKSFEESNTSMEVSISRFRFFEPDKEYSAFLTSPVFYKNSLVGIISLQIPNTIFQNYQNYQGLGKTGEILTVSREQDEMIFLSPFRGEMDKSVKEKIAMTENMDESIKDVANGKNGSGEFIDFRGKKVIAIWKYLPDYDWGVIIKIDSSEAFGFITTLRFIALLIISIALAISIFIVRKASHYISAPIVELNSIVNIIAKGDIDIPIPRIDNNTEMKELFASFDTMKINLIASMYSLEEMSEELSQSNKHLEERVQERTLELSGANEELEASFESLKNAQDQLVQSEKMASLGQIIAGVAHELNTPFGAIRSSSGNIKEFLTTTFKDLPEFFTGTNLREQELSFQLLENSMNSNIELVSERQLRTYRKELIQKMEEWNLEDPRTQAEILVSLGVFENPENYKSLITHSNSQYILNTIYKLSEISKNSKNISTAVEKANKIIFALKTFSRFDQTGEKFSASLKDNIETVIVLYHNYMKHGIELESEYEEIAPILCFADELGQVWTNIIHNSLQAMEYKGKLKVSLKTENLEKGRHAVVRISDSGKGIPPETLEKIFQPFFTTKPAGEGSGIGLDIVNKIVKKHDGFIKVESKVGVGTTFKVYLPY
jgi:two-component system, NtrC family, sensor kinase